MKKLLAVLICAVTMVSSTFALGFCVGAKGFLGTDFDTNADIKQQAQAITKLNANSDLDFGFGAYTNLTLFAGLGVQAEANLTRGKTTFNVMKQGVDTFEAQELSVWTLDIPLMVWLRGELGPFQLGFGAGPNFAFNIPAGDFKSLYDKTRTDIANNVFTMGVCIGADAKFFFNKHLGLVVGARYINDFMKTDVPVVVAGYDTGSSYPTVAISRKALYANVGLEFKLF